jgi:hypothetical protein
MVLTPFSQRHLDITVAGTMLQLSELDGVKGGSKKSSMAGIISNTLNFITKSIQMPSAMAAQV